MLKVFVDLHKQGLIYRDKRLVNWDPKFQTAISDLEVQQVEKTGSFKWQRGGEEAFDAAKLDKVLSRDPSGHLWHFNYPLEGVAYDPDDASTFITVATTRPETMLGDTGVAVHPEDERYGASDRPATCVLPLVGRLIPIVADDYADPGEGHRRGQDHAGARLQRFRGRQAPRARRHQHPRRRGADAARRQRGLPGRRHRRSRRRWRSHGLDRFAGAQGASSR